MDSQHVKVSKRLLEFARQYSLSYFLINLKENQLQKLCFSSIWNLDTVFPHIDIRSQVFFLSQSECLTQPIQMLLSQNQKIFCELFLHFRKLHKIWNTLKNKMSLGRHFFSDIIDCKKRGYLNAQKAPCQNTYEQWTC